MKVGEHAALPAARKIHDGVTVESVVDLVGIAVEIAALYGIFGQFVRWIGLKNRSPGKRWLQSLVEVQR